MCYCLFTKFTYIVIYFIDKINQHVGPNFFYSERGEEEEDLNQDFVASLK